MIQFGQQTDAQTLSQEVWDVIVIGTGIGGGTIGRALAEAGQRVLFLEKGPRGHRAEAHGLNDAVFLPEARTVRGYWPDKLHALLNGRASDFYAPLGAGVGGSSVFYAATLERPERHDLDHSDTRPHPTGGWPVGFDAMLPWYAQAARMYRLSGSPDPLSSEPEMPLRAPAPLSSGDAALKSAFEGSGLHPYHLHAAIQHLPGCASCMGRKCPRPCKMDGRSAGVEPALATGQAQLLDRCDVTRLIGVGREIAAVEAHRDGETLTFRANRYVLAGGALGSPRLMLASANDSWPQGAGNGSGLVGRNLMFHMNEMLAIWPPRGAPDSGPSKALSLRDLYHRDGQRFGTVQAMGIDAAYGEIVFYLNNMLERSGLRSLRFLRPLTRIPAALAARLFGRAKIFVGLLEDLPYPENRVLLDPGDHNRLAIDYTFHPELLQRRRAFRRAIRAAFRGQRKAFLGLTPELNFGHPCGTLRFGLTPENSVLTPECRSHEIDNLYVVDASFMPTSMGVNPSLTIAANALRVAAHMTSESVT
ncbi:GMC oxidoreductase [Puniceibacterium sp. IMCC21224]|uniref:GMC oxidoreductase n=1 Tax=Puniceibacterium sp. IMCC21224 TaxID=1618204 RepID=UPI00064D933B|nr:GMC family oxidoreductase [Puniceibacterium sp. IMCC21224]KMK65654.1 choline dehydrogenase-like flavoprotein [Puniceibacterium sp. IMCC21224]